MDCYACRGKTNDCEVCGGENRIEVRTCPHRLIKAIDHHMCIAADFYSNGQTPGNLAYDELPAAFLDAVGLILRERKHIQEQGGGD